VIPTGSANSFGGEVVLALFINYREFTIALIGLTRLLCLILAFGSAGWPGSINTCYRSDAAK
jgi:hypothetical protein